VDDGARADALRRALTWGIVPTSEAADREAVMAALLGVATPAGATPLATLTASVAKTLAQRRDAAPAVADIPTEAQIAAPLPNQAARFQPDGIPSLARAIVNLVSPNGKLAILACWTTAAFVSNTRLVTNRADTALDEDWLTIVAAARSALARLEALQLELEPPLTTWSNSPDDPWQLARVQANQANRKTNVTKLETPRFAVACGSNEAWAGEKIAVGLIDAFSEAVPMPQRNTSTAFGFNAPAARPPQAILLAVPPKPRQRLDANLLLQIVQETHELAHARTAHLEDLGDLQALTPTAWLPITGPVQMWFEAWPLFE
jgi:hypothetical protein